jgi:hypothetical protein
MATFRLALWESNVARWKIPNPIPGIPWFPLWVSSVYDPIDWEIQEV